MIADITSYDSTLCLHENGKKTMNFDNQKLYDN